MKRFFIYLSYDGTNYSGWQNQPNSTTVQEVLEKAISTILRTPTEITGAGRTDAGVHARMMVAHFDAELDISELQPLCEKLNSFLPKDIAIQKIVPVTNEAHARFDATSRTYRYYLTTEKDPFKVNTHLRLFFVPDIEKMNECANVLFEFEDFSSFSKSHTDVKTNVCKIMYAQWERQGSDFIFTIKADRFLRNMVRAIVGTLLEAGRDRLSVRGMQRIIKAQDRRTAGTSAPAQGLFLEDIEYPESIFLNQEGGNR
ncbi:MAG: tRNA pseudouridine(38-40) synthase TruA [Dysgonomonas sp.]